MSTSKLKRVAALLAHIMQDPRLDDASREECRIALRNVKRYLRRQKVSDDEIKAMISMAKIIRKLYLNDADRG